ncbi:MAG: ABC transporter permease [Oligoflexales bacterium]
MSILLTLAKQEILGHKKFSLFFVLNVSLGLIGFISLDGFKNSFRNHLKENSKELLTADISVSTRRMLTPQEHEISEKVLPKGSLKTSVISLYSMVASKDLSRLVNIKVIDQAFPFYGKINLKNNGLIGSSSKKEILNTPQVWVYQEILDQLKLKIGDKLKIGSQEFKIADVILDDVAVNFSGISFAPKLYLGLPFVEQTSLVQKGSTLWNTIFFKLPKDASSEDYADQLNLSLNAPGIRVSSHENKGENTGRLISYLMDYLGLVALAGFFLAALGVAYFYFSYFAKRLKDLTILLTLGLSPKEVAGIFILQICFLGICAACFSLFIAYSFIPLFPSLFATLFDAAISPSISTHTILLSFLMSIIGTLLICYPLIRKIHTLKPAVLFQEHANLSIPFSPADFISFLPAFLCYWGLAIWQANSWLVGSAFAFGFVGAGLVFTFLYLGIVKLIGNKPSKIKNLSTSMALLYLTRKPFHSLVAFLAISLGVMLLNIVNQTKASLQGELESPQTVELPSFFMFDIQDEQLAPLTEFLNSQGSTLASPSPLVRARLETINGTPYTKPDLDDEPMTREEEQEQRMKNRGFNLSYRQDLSSSESIVKGKKFTKRENHDDPVEISVEVGFAQRLGLKIGDVLKFDIQGVEIEGSIANLRKVKWSSFQPNFFIQFQDGVLNEAPKTWVASVPQISKTDLKQLQVDLVKGFPNISIIDVARLVEKIIAITERMGLILNLMAILSLIIGITILFSICHYQGKLRQWDLNLLKILGSSFWLLRRSFYFEFGLLCLIASSLGAVSAILLTYILASNIFDNIFTLNILTPSISVGALTLIGILTAHFSISSVISKPSISLLSKED